MRIPMQCGKAGAAKRKSSARLAKHDTSRARLRQSSLQKAAILPKISRCHQLMDTRSATSRGLVGLLALRKARRGRRAAAPHPTCWCDAAFAARALFATPIQICVPTGDQLAGGTTTARTGNAVNAWTSRERCALPGRVIDDGGFN
jgi:hypothetical protein